MKNIRIINILLLALTIAVIMIGAYSTAASQRSHTDDNQLNLVPWPRSLERGDGTLIFDDSSRIVYAHQELEPLAEILVDEIEMLTGINLAAGNDASSGGIVLKIDDTMESESYSLEVSNNATVIGSNYEAVAFGTATLLQMIEKRGDDIMLPHVRINDNPAFPYRGWMIDVARQAHSIETLKQAVQLCRLYKVRYLHLHLNDDQGWTFPSTAYPQLGTQNYHGIPRYPLDELKELVRFADERGVTIVPELETPGHAGAVLRTMPEVFDSLDEDGNSRRINVMNMGNEKMYEVLDVIVGEIAEVFASSPYIHIGCDEVWLERVDKTPEAKEYMERHGLGGGYEMYLYHIIRMNEKVKARGKQTIVWEGFHNDGSDNVKIPKDIIVMPFENRENPASNLVRNGYRVINTAWSPLYITRWLRFNPEMVYDWNAFRFGRFPSDGFDFISWDVIEPTPLVLGAQVCNWEQTERYVIPSARKRVPAMVERVWNPEAGKTYADFEHRWRNTDRALSKLILPVEITAEGLWKPDPKPEDDDMRSVNHRLFEDRVSVSLSSIRPLRQGERIHYTLDGTIPSAESPVYETPLSLGKEHCSDHRVTVKARIFRGDEPVGYASWAEYEHDWRSEMPARLEYTVYDVPRYVTRLSDYMQTIPASALTPAGSESGESGLRGEYFANANLQGDPAFTRIDEQIDFDWGTGGPGDAVGTDHFSIRWQGYLTAPETGDYLLATANDDGARLYLDGELLIDDWRVGPVRVNQAEVRLEEGKTYDLRLEYYEDRGQAAVKLLWLNQSYSLEEHLPVVSKGTIHEVEMGPRMPQPEGGHKRAYVFKGRVSVSEEDAGEHEIWLRSTRSTSQLFINGELVIDRQSTDWGRTYETIELPSGIHDVEVIFIGSGMRITQVQLPGELLKLEETP